MPEMLFQLRWPDGEETQCYSPSLIIESFLSPGESYGLADFVARCTEALIIASDRVEAKYGFPCSRARGELARITEKSKQFEADSAASVTVLFFTF